MAPLESPLALRSSKICPSPRSTEASILACWVRIRLLNCALVLVQAGWARTNAGLSETSASQTFGDIG